MNDNLKICRYVLILGLLLVTPALTGQSQRASHTFALGTEEFLLDGKPFQIISGEIHPGRVPEEYWRHRIRMAPAADSYHWQCAHPWTDTKIPLGRLLWGGAESDVGRILDPGERNQDADGPAWVGLYHPRIS